MTDDAGLLRRYAATRSEEAMAELVRRHIGLVYHAALRLCGGDHHRAEDVAQTVFTDLARKAAKLGGHTSLTGWLYTSTRYAAVQAIRSEARRQAREQEAQLMHETNEAAFADWDRVRPAIDDALTALPDRDRDAVLMRFFEGRAWSDIAATFAISEDAARMRVERALDKLRGLLGQRGVPSTAAALGIALAAQASVAVPAGVTTSVTTAAVAGSAVTGAVGFASFLTMTKLQIGIGAAIVALGCGALVWQQRNNRPLRTEVAALREEANEGSRSAAAATKPVPNSAPMPPASAKSAAPATTSPATTVVHTAPMTATLAAGLTPVDQLGNAGTATARSAFATQLWAARAGDVDLESSVIDFTPEGRKVLDDLLTRLPKDLTDRYNTPEKLMAWALAGSPHPLGGMQVVSETPQGPDDVVLATKWQHIDDDIVHESDVHLRRSDQGWKMIVPPALVYRVAAYLRSGGGK